MGGPWRAGQSSPSGGVPAAPLDFWVTCARPPTPLLCPRKLFTSGEGSEHQGSVCLEGICSQQRLPPLAALVLMI